MIILPIDIILPCMQHIDFLLHEFNFFIFSYICYFVSTYILHILGSCIHVESLLHMLDFISQFTCSVLFWLRYEFYVYDSWHNMFRSLLEVMVRIPFG